MQDIVGGSFSAFWRRTAVGRVSLRAAASRWSAFQSGSAVPILAGLALLGAWADPSHAVDRYVEDQLLVKLNPGHIIEEVNDTWGTSTIDVFPAALPIDLD